MTYLWKVLEKWKLGSLFLKKDFW